MARTLHLRVVTPDGAAYEDDVLSVTFPTAAGEITVLPNHTPLVALLRPGEVTVKKEDHVVHFAAAHGVVEIKQGSEVIVLADSLERAEEIDLEAAEAARERAKKMLEEKEHINDVEYARFQSLLDRELNRIKVHRKYRK